jgi:hypothetical protein
MSGCACHQWSETVATCQDCGEDIHHGWFRLVNINVCKECLHKPAQEEES